MGPLTFLLYIIFDLPNCWSKLSFRIFADDTNMFYTEQAPNNSVSRCGIIFEEEQAKCKFFHSWTSFFHVRGIRSLEKRNGLFIFFFNKQRADINFRRTSFALLRSALICLRGSKARRKAFCDFKNIDIDVETQEGAII